MDKPADQNIPANTPDKPKIIATEPVSVELEAGTTYFFCTCGLSAKLPYCDSAHKGTGYKSFQFTPAQSGTAIVKTPAVRKEAA